MAGSRYSMYTIKRHMDEDASRVMGNFLSAKPERVVSSKGYTFFKDLETARFWAVLGGINKDHAARRRARMNFSEGELAKIVNIAVSQAINFHGLLPAPGSYRGNGIVYDHLVQENSLVAEFAPRDIPSISELQNARFWESLPGMTKGVSPNGYGTFTDVLVNHSDSLDPGFVNRGLEIFRRANPAFDFPAFLPDLTGVDNRALTPYLDLFLNAEGKLDETSGVSKEQFKEAFFRPFVERVLETDEDGCLSLGENVRTSPAILLANQPCREILTQDPDLLRVYRREVGNI